MPWNPSQIPASIYASAEFFDRLAPESGDSQTPPPSAEPQPSTSSASVPATSSASPPQTSPYPVTTDHSYASPTKTIKHFFLKRLTPMLSRPLNTNVNRQKAVKRQYGESLTSEECIERLMREEEEKMAKKRPTRGKCKGKGKKTSKPPPPTAASQSQQIEDDSDSDNSPPPAPACESDSSYSDIDNDPDWTPKRQCTDSRRNIFDTFQ